MGVRQTCAVTDTSVLIADRDELLALHRMLLHAKFTPDDLDEFRGSPFIAAIERRLAEALSAQHDGSVVGRLDDAPHVIAAVRARIQRTGSWWSSASGEDRRRFVRDLITPYEASEELLASLVE